MEKAYVGLRKVSVDVLCLVSALVRLGLMGLTDIASATVCVTHKLQTCGYSKVL